MTHIYLDLVFDGPPDHHGSRFLGCRNGAGVSVEVGRWVDRTDGTWALRLTREDIRRPPTLSQPTPEQLEARWRQDHPDCEPAVRIYLDGRLAGINCTAVDNHR